MDGRDESEAGRVIHKFLILFRYLRQYGRQINEHGIRPRQFSVLRYLREAGPATIGDVQAYLYSSPSSASTVVSQLEAAGLVTRTRSTEDNRVVIVALTGAGAEVSQQTPLGGIPLLRRRLTSLPEQRLQVIDTALDELLGLLEVGEDQ